jgi:hypothetical protein
MLPPAPLWNPIVPVAAPHAVEPPPAQFSEQHAIRRPAREPQPAPEPAEEEYPAVVELKNGAVYTVTRYWVAGKTFHFITTHFDHVQVPMTMLDRLADARKPQSSSLHAAGQP